MLTRIRTHVFFLLLLQILVHTSLWSQEKVIALDPITVTASRKILWMNDFLSIKMDSVSNGPFAVSDLTELLKSETTINLTQYGGQGSLASVRLRGTGPAHTQINWNGIPINNPTTGSIDLSLVSSFMTDELQVAYGAAGSHFGSGTFGGSLNLINRADWSNRIQVMVQGETGSWLHRKFGTSIRMGTDSWQLHTGGYLQNSPNTYRFTNSYLPGNPEQTRINDSLRLAGGQHHLFIKLPHKWYLQIGAWHQYRDKDLPSSMSSGIGTLANQKDLSQRIFVRASKYWSESLLELTAARLSDSLLYTEYNQTESAVNRASGMNSTIVTGGAVYRMYPNNSWVIELGGDAEGNRVFGSSYAGVREENRANLFATGRYSRERLMVSGGLRQAFYSVSHSRTLYSFALGYAVPSLDILIKAQVSNKFRLPTLNERFWQPGGNPDLLSESGSGFDAIVEWNQSSSGGFSTHVSGTVFHQGIRNWVQWVPMGTYWSPENVRSVSCQGVETTINTSRHIGMILMDFRSQYSYTESHDLDIVAADSRRDRQMPYIPRHQFQSRLTGRWNDWELFTAYRFTSKRFTTDDHDPWLVLPPVHLVDFGLSRSIAFKQFQSRISMRLNNAFNQSYQLIRAYPAPGRFFSITVQLMFNKKSDFYAND